MKLDTNEEILQEAKAITEFKGRDLRQWLYREILLNALKTKKDELDESFADLLESGEIEKSGPLRQENDDPELLSKRRISFRNN